LRDVCFLTLGLNIGSTVTPGVLSSVATGLQSFVVLTLTLVVSIITCSALLGRVFGFGRMTALLSAAPGHLSYVLSLSEDLRSDIPRVAVVQAMRVFFLTLLVPVLLMLWGIDEAPPLLVIAPMALGSMVALFALSAGAAIVLRRLRVPAAWLLGGMFVSAFGHATELSPGLLPAWLTLGAFTVMGTVIGTRFRGQSLADLRRNLAAGLCVTLVACAIAAIGALVVAEALSLSPALLLIAFAPGGVEVMAAMAVQIGVEPTFVAAHHVFRLVILTVLIPVFVGCVQRRG
jgi:membrane AbrB-like protein